MLSDPPTFDLTFLFNDTATTEIYTLSLHDALPISSFFGSIRARYPRITPAASSFCTRCQRSEEHTSELQSHSELVCRLLLGKKQVVVMATMVRSADVLTLRTRGRGWRG